MTADRQRGRVTFLYLALLYTLLAWIATQVSGSAELDEEQSPSRGTLVVSDPPSTTDTPNPFPSIPDDPENENRNCRLLGPFALFIQAIMGVVVVGTLIFKRQREKPKRPWKIWLLDISKQLLGQLFVHTLNILLSSLGSMASKGEENPCSLYFLNIAIDTTLGVFFIYVSMRYLTHYFTDVLGWPGFVSGQYMTTPKTLGRRRRTTRVTSAQTSSSTATVTSPTRNEGNDQDGDSNPTSHFPSKQSGNGKGQGKRQRPRLSYFFRQLCLYLFSLFIMKLLVLLLFALFPFLFDLGGWVLHLFGDNRRGQVIFVMALFPLAMNTLQFWLIDSLLRHNPLTSVYKSEEEARAVSEGGEHGEGDVEGEGPFRWWNGGQGRELGYSSVEQRSSIHLVGDASDEENDEEGLDHEEEEEEEEEDRHEYPPNSSNRSSLTHFHGARNASQGQDQTREADETPNLTYGARTTVSPPVPPTRGISEELLREAGKTLSDGASEGADDLWDNWGDEETSAHQPLTQNRTHQTSSESVRLSQR